MSRRRSKAAVPASEAEAEQAPTMRGSAGRYKALVSEALEMCSGELRTLENMRRAEGMLEEAIKLCPQRRDAHGILAQLLVVRDHDEAVRHYAIVCEMSMLHDELWAKSFVSVFEHFQNRLHRGDSALVPPAWWTDRCLREAAPEVKTLLPSYEWRAVRMHAIVLSAPVYPWCTWEQSTRTTEELLAAADSYQEIVKLVGQARKGNYPVAIGPEDRSLLKIGNEDIKTYIELALQCRRVASMPEEYRVPAMESNIKANEKNKPTYHDPEEDPPPLQ